MSESEHDYDIHLDDKFGHLALIDLAHEAAPMSHGSTRP